MIPYLSFSFHLINHAADVQVMKDGCNVAVEMIALLEDEERARAVAANNSPLVTGLAGYVRRCFTAAYHAKRQTIEQRMLANVRARRGE